MKRVGFRPEAALDVRSAYLWYEEQQTGLGEEFLAGVEKALEAVLAFPESHPVVHRETRRVLVERFPYGIYYRVSSGEVTVVACMHGARDPDAWQSRLDG